MRNVLKAFYLNLRAFLLNVAGVFFPSEAPPLASPARILFIRIDRIGDMVLSTPALRALKEKYPGARLSVLASPVMAPLIESDPCVDHVIVWDRTKRWRGVIETIKSLRRSRFDLAVDPRLDYELNTALIAFASGAKVRAGYALYGRGIFFNLRAAPPKERGHFVEEAFKVLKPLGIERAGRDPELFISGGAKAEASAFLKNYGADEKGFLAAVHPGGYYPSQRWFPERFAEVIRWLMDKHNARVLLIGSGQEWELIDDIADRASKGPDKKNIIKLIDFKMDVLSALIRKCRIFIGNNSGPLHIAAALRIPSVSTMGPTDPVRWRPLGPDQIVLRGNAPCDSCRRGSRGTHECMKDITAAMVQAGAERLLNSQRGGK